MMVLNTGVAAQGSCETPSLEGLRTQLEKAMSPNETLAQSNLEAGPTFNQRLNQMTSWDLFQTKSPSDLLSHSNLQNFLWTELYLQIFTIFSADFQLLLIAHVVFAGEYHITKSVFFLLSGHIEIKFWINNQWPETLLG